jgi:hypothetical protein
MPGGVSYRERAQAAYDSFSATLTEGGEDAYLAAVEKTLARPRKSPQYTARLFGALAVELDRRAAVASIELDELAPDTLHQPISEADVGDFFDASRELVGHLSPSSEFCNVVTMDEKLQRVLNITDDELEGESDDLIQIATTKGRNTLAFRGTALLPLMTDMLERQGVVASDDLIRATRVNGRRLLNWWALSEKNFGWAPYSLQATKSTDVKTRLARMYHPYGLLTSVTGAYFTVKRDKKGEVQIRSSTENYTHIGCPVTLMRQKVIDPAWKGMVDLAIQGGYYGEEIHNYTLLDLDERIRRGERLMTRTRIEAAPPEQSDQA